MREGIRERSDPDAPGAENGGSLPRVAAGGTWLIHGRWAREGRGTSRFCRDGGGIKGGSIMRGRTTRKDGGRLTCAADSPSPPPLLFSADAHAG